MTKRTKRRREIERLFALRDREGCSLRQLSERSGIPVGTLSWWSHRLREDRAPAFTEVRVVADAVAESELGDGHGVLRLRLPSGIVAEFEGALAERATVMLVEGAARWS